LLDALIQLQKQIRTESIVDRKKRAAEHVPRVTLGPGEVLLPKEGQPNLHWGVQKAAYPVEELQAEGKIALVRGNVKYRHERRDERERQQA
jgi:hypothetical protein